MADKAVDNNAIVVDDDDGGDDHGGVTDKGNGGNGSGYENSQTPFSPKMRARPRKFHNNFRNDLYNSAYGNYNGGYGGHGFGYGRNVMPPNNYGPPPPLFPPEPLQGPPGPPGFMLGRGFGPHGPPMRRQPLEDRTTRYLIRCGVSKESLKNFPRELLLLMEPEYCGLCGHNLESFATSRVHYISKNHLKNQKKWLNQKSEVSFRKGGEMLMKARELYCELCDVHITSKLHSDSHYAGKPHRSIVEGRKKPKNPFLLQPGMQARVAQLIRREKRHIKVGEDEEVEEKAKEVKSSQPDLYCDICKTSVTCSEQMTMHLNGKRHLNKEKQHILKMMKGEGDKTTAAVPDAQEKDNEEIEDQEETEKKEEDNYDWGNGSGDWDEVKNDDVY